MRRLTNAALVAAATFAAATQTAPIAAQRSAAAAGTLQIYFIDVEGGQSTLVVTPDGESLLVDTGFPGDGTFRSLPGDPAKARDAQRILAAALDAGLTKIDDLLLTHYHADHAGGIVELAKLLPIGTFIDHAAPNADADKAVAGTQATYERYLDVRATGKHIAPKPGDRLPLTGVIATVIATEGRTIAARLPGGGRQNPACANDVLPASEKTENPRSTAIRLDYGSFRLLDVGDLTGAPLHALTCPVDLIGESSVYLVAHHGGNDAAEPALFAAVKPLVAILNNGPTKGAQADTLKALAAMPAIDTWQLHRTLNDDAMNVDDARIANLDDTSSAWLKVSAKRDGSFSVTNGRTGAVRNYRRR